MLERCAAATGSHLSHFRVSLVAPEAYPDDRVPQVVVVREGNTKPGSNGGLAIEPARDRVATIPKSHRTAHGRKRELNIMTVIGIDEALQNHSGVYDGRDAWELALRTLIARERNRRQSGTSALSDQLERYSMRQVPLRLERVINPSDVDARDPIVRCAAVRRPAYGHVDLLKAVGLLEARTKPAPEQVLLPDLDGLVLGVVAVTIVQGRIGQGGKSAA